MKIRPKLPYFLFLFIISIVGCAVLKIDVDVYKGPLSNHDDVQIEQMAAMAMGAKNLLVQLRNDLEIEKIKKDDCDKIQRQNRIKAIESLRERIDTTAGSVTVSNTPAQFGFGSGTFTVNADSGTYTASASILTSKLALNVNDILFLYKDQKGEGIEKSIKTYFDDKTEINRNALIDEVVRFAQRVLTIANYNEMFRGKIWIQRITEWETSFGLRINSYVIILQAIGNSLLTQADELQHKASYKKKIEDPEAMKGEWWAMGTATNKVGETVENTGAKNTKDLFDRMIARLKHTHIQAVEKDGADSEIAKYCDEALQLAYSYRSSMTYIIPPSAYLRNSYPSTSLQSDPGLVWENMLGEHALRNIPFMDWLYTAEKYKAKGLVVAELDKQYWQNINSVRVAGAGSTNYVVAKDDIGNWYVKRYSSNPKDIINSAKKLALFNLGAAGMMNVDLVNRLNSKIDQEKVQQSQQDQYGVQDGESKAPEVTGEKSEANRTTLEHIFDKYEGQYTEKTNIDYDNLRTILGTSSTQTSSTLETKIVDVWGKDEDTKKVIEKLKSKLTSAAEINLRSASKELPENLDEEEKDKKPKDKKTRAERIISALREIKQFHSRLISGIHDLELTNEPSQKLGEAQKDKETKEKEETIAKNEKTTAQDEYDKVKNDAEKEPEAKRTRDTAVGAHTMAQAALGTATSNFKTASDDLESAENAEKFAIKSATYIVRDVLMKVVEERIDVVGNYETGIIFIGDAIKPNKKE
ncbi:MAG: hypothetical protein F9K48_02765 [Candidatus Brocadia sp.]|nr:MAG: hypothetical protein F9K48_02765 [Candidatus Brocadia sp.]